MNPTPDGESSEELSTALAVRQAYSWFRSALLQAPGEDDLERSLGIAAEALRRLLSGDVFADVRLTYKLLLRHLRERLAERKPWDRPAGQRLWSDLMTSARMLGGINHREVLRLHDHLVLSILASQFSEIITGLGRDHWEICLQLLGLDDAFDDCLRRGFDWASERPERLTQVLRRLAAAS